MTLPNVEIYQNQTTVEIISGGAGDVSRYQVVAALPTGLTDYDTGRYFYSTNIELGFVWGGTVRGWVAQGVLLLGPLEPVPAGTPPKVLVYRSA